METIMAKRQRKINAYRKEMKCKDGNKIIQFTHGRDLDGKISGMIGELYAMSNCNDIQLELIDNSAAFNEIITKYISNRFKGYDIIIISDLTLNENNAAYLNELIEQEVDKEFIICDHHKADYITENKNYSWRKYCSRSEDQECGASLLYKALELSFPIELRSAIRGVAETTRIYDNFIWKKTNDLVARNMSRISYLNPSYIEDLKTRIISLTSENETLDLFSDEDKKMLIEEDERVSKYIETKKKYTVVNKVYIDDRFYNVACTFATKYQSELGSDICSTMDVDFVCMINPENNSISLRGQGKIDLSQVAKKYFNGGGHPDASGGCFDASRLLVGLEHIFFN